MKIQIIGASDSGTTTLGRALSHALNIPAFDSDEYFWEKTDPPFTTKRPREERQRMLQEAIAGRTS